MQTYISFLRSVNIAGHNLIKMTELSELFKKMGFSDVKTYIQSGNIIFSISDDLTSSDLSDNLEKAILGRFSLQIHVMTRTTRELSEMFSNNPYLKEPDFDPSKSAVLFLHEEPSDAQIQKVKDINYPPDRFKIIGKEIFIYCPNGFGRTKIYTNFFEKKMGVIGTGRNWKTVTTVLNLITP